MVRHSSPRVFRYLAGAARIALIVVGSSPLWVAWVQGVPVLGQVADLLQRWFNYQCHRELGRSWAWLGRELPVCTRCFGIYLGLMLGALALRPRLTPLQLRLWVGGASLLMLLDVFTEALGMRPPAAILRFVTGLLLAYPVGVSVVLSLAAGAKGQEAAAGAVSATSPLVLAGGEPTSTTAGGVDAPAQGRQLSASPSSESVDEA